MKIKIYNKLPRYIVDKLPNLVWTHHEQVIDEEVFFCCFDDNGKFVGVMDVEFQCFKRVNDKFKFLVYIERFEVTPDRRGEGWGKQMFQWLINNYDIYRVELCHCDRYSDDSSSYKWWRHMGFRKEDAEYSMMYKNIK